MPKHKVGTREEWSAGRKKLLEREQELGNLDEELAKRRKELPWVAVEKEYVFDTEEGRRTLAEWFVWKFFGEAPGWLQEWAENVGRIWSPGWPSRRAGMSSRWKTAPSTTRTRARRPTASCSPRTTANCSTRSPTDETPTSRCAAMTSTEAKEGSDDGAHDRNA